MGPMTAGTPGFADTPDHSHRPPAATASPDVLKQELDAIAERAGKDAHGVPVELLEGYLQALVEVSTTGRKVGPDELRLRHDLGARAAERGVPMRSLVDLYLSATWLAWPQLPGVRHAPDADAVRAIGQAVFRAADTSIIALADGYEEAQRLAMRREESLRREFIDDLLEGRNPGQLAENAGRYGLQLAGTHTVAVAATAERFVDGGPAMSQIESALQARFGARTVLATTKDGLLVCIASHTAAATDVAEQIARQVSKAAGPSNAWRIGIGRPEQGPGGPVRSFEQARNALDIADRLGLDDDVVKASDLLVYQVLLRDSAALSELVSVVLDPLRYTRAGPKLLLETLAAYFAAGRVSTAAAKQLHIAVRTVTYRLQRVQQLTGYSADDPAQGFTLQVAVYGARLLGWPNADG